MERSRFWSNYTWRQTSLVDVGEGSYVRMGQNYAGNDT